LSAVHAAGFTPSGWRLCVVLLSVHRPVVVAQRIGRLLEQDSSAAGLFKVDVNEVDGRA